MLIIKYGVLTFKYPPFIILYQYEAYFCMKFSFHGILHDTHHSITLDKQIISLISTDCMADTFFKLQRFEILLLENLFHNTCRVSGTKLLSSVKKDFY